MWPRIYAAGTGHLVWTKLPQHRSQGPETSPSQPHPRVILLAQNKDTPSPSQSSVTQSSVSTDTESPPVMSDSSALLVRVSGLVHTCQHVPVHPTLQSPVSPDTESPPVQSDSSAPPVRMSGLVHTSQHVAVHPALPISPTRGPFSRTASHGRGGPCQTISGR